MKWNQMFLFQVNDLASKLELRGARMPEEVSFSFAAAIKASRRNPICLRFIGPVPLLFPFFLPIITSVLRIALPNNAIYDVYLFSRLALEYVGASVLL